MIYGSKGVLQGALGGGGRLGGGFFALVGGHGGESGEVGGSEVGSGGELADKRD